MTKERMEAFSNGVLAVFITIIVLDMKRQRKTWGTHLFSKPLELIEAPREESIAKVWQGRD